MKDSAQGAERRRDTVSRRDFIRIGGLGVVALSAAESVARAAAPASPWRNCVFLLMTGGPSHLDTFDPKPEAPLEYRGPLRSISTAVSGIALSETLPRLAQRADQFALIRSLGHDAAAIHETGLQLLQTGQLSHRGRQPAHFGSVAAQRWGSRGTVPPSVVLPERLSATGLNIWQGQGAGVLGGEHEPRIVTSSRRPFATSSDDAMRTIVDFPEESAAVRSRYGDSRFGELCLQARQCVEAGVRCVTVNLFDSLNGQKTWDCHGRAPWSPSTILDYRDTLGPQFDRAASALLDDLADRGLLEETLVIATGEFGRTPKVNEQGGRDHWTRAWSALVAGGGVRGGQVIGRTDSRGYDPVDRPVHPSELHATILSSLGIPADASDPEPVPAAAASVTPFGRPLAELFA